MCDMYVCVCMCTCQGRELQNLEEGIGFHRTVVKGSCGLPNMNIGEQTQTLCKSSVSS